VWYYALLVFVFVYCYGRIFYTIRRQSRICSEHGHGISMSRDPDTGQPMAAEQQTTSGGTGGSLTRVELNVLQTMVAVVVCFVICWAPNSFVAVLSQTTVYVHMFASLAARVCSAILPQARLQTYYRR